MKPITREEVEEMPAVGGCLCYEYICITRNTVAAQREVTVSGVALTNTMPKMSMKSSAVSPMTITAMLHSGIR